MADRLSSSIGAGAFATAFLALTLVGQTAAAQDPVAQDAVTQSPAAVAGSNGETLFKARCADCHSGDDERAPGPADLAAMKPEAVFDVMKNGPMAPMAGGLTDDEMRAIAAFVTTPKP